MSKVQTRARFEHWSLGPLNLVWFLSLASLLLVLLPGCASAVKNARTTALTGVDLISMTDDMAARIAASEAVREEIAKKGSLKIVVMPVVNNLRAEVIPRGQAVAFTGRVRTLLMRHSPEKYTWVMNREAFHELVRRERELQVDPGPSPDIVNPEYALTATFSSLTDENAKQRESFYVCIFELTSLQDRSLLWSGSYEVKKQAVKGFLD